MPEYKKLMREFVVLKTSLKAAQGKLEAKAQELSQVEREERLTGDNLENEINKHRALELERHTSSILGPMKREIAEVSGNLDALKRDKNIKLNSLELKTSEEDSILGSIEPVLEEMVNLIRKELGDEIVDSLISKVPKRSIKMDKKSLAMLKKYMNGKLKQIEVIERGVDKDFISKGLTSMYGYLEESSSKDYAIVIGSLAIILTLPFISMAYIPYTVFTSVSNIRYVNMYKGLLSDYVLVKHNINKFRKMESISSKVRFNDEVLEIDKEFRSKIEETSSILEKLESDYEHKAKIIPLEFKFSDEGLREQNSTKVSSFIRSKQGIRREIEDLESEVERLEASIVANRDASDAIFEKSKEEFLSFKFDSYSLPKNWIIDFSNGTTVQYKYEEGSCLFLVDNVPDLEDLAVLILFQIKGKLNPHAYRIEVWDTRSLGFALSGAVGASESVTIKDTTAAVESSLESLSTLVRARRVYLAGKLDTMELYNEFMLSINSLVEPYKLVFIFNLDATLLGNSEFISLLDSGKKSGIYFYIFSHTVDVTAEFEILVRYMTNFYNVEDGEFQKLSTQLAEEFIKSKG